MRVLHKLEDGQLVHEVIEKEPEEVQKWMADHEKYNKMAGEKKSKVELPENLIKKLQELPETGMGYQVVNLKFIDGKILRDIMILNYSIAILDEDIDVSQIVEIELSKEPEEVQKGPLEETDLSKLKVPTIVWIPKFLRVSGSQIYAKDRKPDDIDVIACGEEDDKDRIVVPLDKPLRLKIDRFLEKRFWLKGETSWHGTPYGANWKNLPIFDLALIPRNPLKFEEMNESEFAAEFYKSEENVGTEVTEKAMGAEAKKMADASKKEDKIEVGRFFMPLKTSLSPFEYRVGEVYGIDEMIDKLKQLAQRRKADTEIVPVYIEKKYD